MAKAPSPVIESLKRFFSWEDESLAGTARSTGGKGAKKWRGSGEDEMLFHSLMEGIGRLIEVSTKDLVENPNVKNERFETAIASIIDRYHEPFSVDEHEQINKRAVKLIAEQRHVERSYLEKHEEELRSIIAHIGDEVQGVNQDSGTFNQSMSDGLDDIRKTEKLADIRLVRAQITKGLSNLNRALVEKKEKEDKRIGELMNQVDILKFQLDSARHDSQTDGLTSLYNRAAFDAHLIKAMKESSSSNQGLCLILFDIDLFKKFNDTYGHLAGDEVLTRFAEVLDNSFEREQDFVARYGGEEFVVLMSGTTLKDAHMAADTFRRRIEETTVQFEAEALKVTVSGGVAQYLTGEKGEGLVKRSDQALYRAKETGRNRIIAISSRK